MDNAIYAALSRQSGLINEMQVIANNIANASTTGFRREGVTFSEFVGETAPGEPSLSMANGNIWSNSALQGALTQTGGIFDFAIEGEGYFQVATPNGNMLTRAGSFSPNAEGDLVSNDGHRLLDSGGSAINVPPGADIVVARDGTVSAEGQPIAQVGIFLPADPNALRHVGGTLFETAGAIDAAEAPMVLQGFVENSNVDPVTEIARMIEVQRAYELGQKLLDQEDERIRNVIQSASR